MSGFQAPRDGWGWRDRTRGIGRRGPCTQEKDEELGDDPVQTGVPETCPNGRQTL